MRITSIRSAVNPPENARTWKSVISHSHMLRSKNTDFEGAKNNLLKWCSVNQISAVGVGSPWEPVSASHYGYYEHGGRDLYYAGKVDPKSVMDKKEIFGMFDELNARSGGKTLFYQDNENPKGRYGHSWFFGYNYDFPAWHDYSQDKPVSFYDEDPECEINPVNGKPQTRRNYIEIVATQRKAGALAVFAHPTSWWFGKNKSFVSNIASQIGLQLLIDGTIDGVTVQGYDALHRHYLELWFHLLDSGSKVPAFGEMDACFDQETISADGKLFRNFMKIPGEVTMASIVACAKSGNVFASSDPFLSISVDGIDMGGSVETGKAILHKLKVEAYPAAGERKLSRIEIIGRGGKTLAFVEDFDGGLIELEAEGFSEPSYFVARSFGQFDRFDAPRQQSIKHMAITNPVYLTHRNSLIPKPMDTNCELFFRDSSSWLGGKISLEKADGEQLDAFSVKSGSFNMEIPASARFRISW